MSRKLLTILTLLALACELCLASPTIKFGSHKLSFKRPSFRAISPRRAHSDGEEPSELSLPLARDSSRSLKKRRDPIECTKETFDLLISTSLTESIDEIDEIEEKMRRAELQDCSALLTSELKETIERAEIPDEDRLELFLKYVKDADDDSDFSTDKLYQHVPRQNLVLALISYLAELKVLRDPRSKKFNFEDILRREYDLICNKVARPEFLALKDKFDRLNKVLYSRDPTLEPEQTLEKWMSYIRVCSYLPEPHINELTSLARDVLLKQLGNDRIHDNPELDN